MKGKLKEYDIELFYCWGASRKYYYFNL